MAKTLAALLAAAKTIPTGGFRTGSRRVIHQQLVSIINETGDFDIPTSCAVRNEVQGIATDVGTVVSGTYALTFVLRSGQTFTTGAIAFDAVAATIQAAIDVAATAAAVPNWTNADIVITGGPLSTTAIVITFSGASVAGQNHGQTTEDGALLVGGGTAGAQTTSVHGQTERSAWAAMLGLSLITDTPPAQGVDPSSVTARSVSGSFPHNLDGETVMAIINEVVAQDENEATRALMLTALGLP